MLPKADTPKITLDDFYRVFSHRHVWVPPALLIAVLFYIQSENFLLFHTLAELIVVMVAILIYVIAWQTYRFSHNAFFMFLASGYIWIAALDVAHTFAYKGVGIVSISVANPATQLWISARYGEAVILLLAPFFLIRPLYRRTAFTVIGMVAAVLFALVMSGDFPDAYIEGQGLTPFKIYSEYTIITLLAGALVHIFLKRAQMTTDVFLLFGASIVLTMVSEFFFTQYIDVYGFSNAIGHLFKFLSFWLMFIAIVRSTLIKPYIDLEREISDRKLAEQSLKEISEELERRVEKRTEQLHDMQSFAHLGSWQANIVTGQLTWSDEIYRIFGHTPGSFEPSVAAFHAAVHPDDLEMVHESERRAEKTGIHDVIHRVVRPDGSIRYVHELAQSQTDATGKLASMFGSVQDVTEIKEAQVSAEQANKAKSLFLSSMSHELRTPMNAILGFTQMLEYNPKEPLTETQKQSVSNVLKGGNHLLRLIEDVLDLSKIDAGQLSLAVDHVSPRHVIDECLMQVQARAEKNNLEIIDATSETDLPLLWTDETRLAQVLLNLLSNAVKYNRPGGTVTLSSEEMANKMLRFSVTDTGDGIPADRQKNLFVPFERLGREAGTIEGTGIGLTITKRIIEVLGGIIGFESDEGTGSTFWVDVPVSKKQDVNTVNVNMAKSTGKMIGKLSKEGSRHSVLYVEDDPTNVQLMEMIVGQFSDVKLITAHNAELGLELARHHKPNLILMDINLPGMNGLAALKQLQDTERTKDIPVIALTAATMHEDVAAGIKAGFKAYVTKPVNVEKILHIIEDAITDD